MNPHFLCPGHRNWLLSAPRRAPVFWQAPMLERVGRHIHAGNTAPVGVAVH